MNEIDLIREVEKRPILYNKSVSGFNKTKLRDDAWKEVQDALNVTEAECKKRWRSLRDSFIKLQRTHGGRTRWPYHQHMRFLLPHVEPTAPKPVEEAVEVPEPARRDQQRHSHSDSSDQEEDKMHVPVTYNQLPVTYAIDPRNITQLSEDDDDVETPHKKPRLNSATEEETTCSCNRTDPDELFLLSCASALKRLNGKRNATARLKIQQVLYEAEFGGRGDLPFVQPTSDCAFDNSAAAAAE